MATETPNIGLSPQARSGIVEVLSVVLADEYTFYTKLRKYHWNVEGPQFVSLHQIFEEQYTLIETVIDELAERIRQYGAMSPGTLAEFKEHTRLEEKPGHNPDARKMVSDIAADHAAMVRHLREDVSKVGEEMGDVASEDFLTGLLQLHQKQMWMMQALVDGKPVA